MEILDDRQIQPLALHAQPRATPGSRLAARAALWACLRTAATGKAMLRSRRPSGGTTIVCRCSPARKPQPINTYRPGGTSRIANRPCESARSETPIRHDQQTGFHLGMDVAKDLHEADVVERHALGLSLSVAIEIERCRLAND